MKLCPIFLLLLIAMLSPACVCSTHPKIQIYPSLGTPQRLVVRGRVFRNDPEDNQPRSSLSRNVRRLLGNKEWEHAPLKVSIAGLTQNLQADDEGLFEASFTPAVALAPQTYAARVEAPGTMQEENAVRVVQPGQLVLVSDFDDTVAITNVTQKSKMVQTALIKNERTQPAVLGMAELYRCFHSGTAANPPAAILYLSGSPLQFYARIRAFLGYHQFAVDAVMLRHLNSIIHDTGVYKRERLTKLMQDLPDSKFVFFGDSGEHDPEVYADIMHQAGDRVVRTYIRLVTNETRAAPRFNNQFAFVSALEAAEDAAARGLITVECKQGVAQAIDAGPHR